MSSPFGAHLLQAAVEADPFRWDLAARGSRTAGGWRPPAALAGRPDVPGLVTLRPSASAGDLRGVEVVRDSFADLKAPGFAVLLNGAWVVRPPSTVRPSAVWSVTPDRAEWLAGWGDPSLPVPQHPDVLLVARHAHGRLTAGAVATVLRGREVLPDGQHAPVAVSLGHLFTAGKDLAPVWRGVSDLLGQLHPGVPVVSHDSGTGLAAALAAGFSQLGPMRLLVGS